MSTTIIFIIAVIALLILIAFLASGVTTKNGKIKAIEYEFKKLQDLYQSKVKEKSNIQSLLDHTNSKYSEILRERNKAIKDCELMIAKFQSIEKDLPNNIKVFNDEGGEINYYRVKVMDENDDFKGYKIGDKVPHIRRKVNGTWKNVPVSLRLVRQ